MTGGRGAATINNRYTIGGGGYGIANSIVLPCSSADTFRYFKMGYGGLELGYIFFSSKKVDFGSTLLIAAGAAFSPGKPKNISETMFGNEFKFLSVIEPSLYTTLWKIIIKQINKMKQMNIHSIIKKGGRIMLIILLILLTCILIILGVLFIMSPGKPKPFLDKNGAPIAVSISEKTFVTIGGIQQGMIIQTKNIHNPVLLYLHGGIPDYYLSKKYPTGLEDYFTVVWWDQRGAGLSFNTNIPEESMTLEQMISDTKEVTNYLRNRFGQDKIYLMGRSGGTFIGVHVAAQFPELYHAYIGIAQMSNHLKSERLAYEYILNEYRDAGKRKMVRNLEASPVTDLIPYGYLKLRDEAMHTIGIGTTREMRSIIRGVFLPSLTCRDYTLAEKINMWRGKAKAGVHPLWDTILVTDLTKQVPELKIPVYFFHGKYDYTVSYDLAKDYFEKIKAPLKGFYTFEQSAHSPMFEEPEKCMKIMKTDVLKGSNSLADKN